MKRTLIGAFAIMLVFGLVGCESIGDKGREDVAGGIDGDVEVNGDDMTVKTEDGEVTITGDRGEIPAEFPDDFPIYSGAEVDSTSSIASENDTTYYINLVSSDEVNEIYEWYKSEFSGAGWEIKGDVNMASDSANSAMLTVEKKSMEGTLTIMTTDGGAEIGIILLVEG